MIRPCALAVAGAGAVTALTVPVALFDGTYRSAVVLGVVAAVFIAIGAAAHRWLPAETERTEAQRLSVVAAMWLCFTAACALALWLGVSLSPDDAGASQLLDPTSAVFEASSAASTTGLSMVSDPSEIDAWLQFWRSIVQWFGALGIIVFAVLVAEPSGDEDSLVDDEWGTVPDETANGAVRRVGVVLLALTAASIGAMVVIGEPVWRAVNHGMTAAATGGFAITEESAAASGPGAQIVIAVTVLLSAISFGTIWDTAKRSGVPIWKRTQIRWGLSFMATGIVASIVLADDQPLGSLIFNSISASTTAGFSIGEAHQFIGAVAAVAMVAMLIGGAAGSTGGGLKVSRVVWLIKAAGRWHPRGGRFDDDEPYCWDGGSVAADDGQARVFGAAAIATTWFATLAAGTIALDRVQPGRHRRCESVRSDQRHVRGGALERAHESPPRHRIEIHAQRADDPRSDRDHRRPGAADTAHHRRTAVDLLDRDREPASSTRPAPTSRRSREPRPTHGSLLRRSAVENSYDMSSLPSQVSPVRRTVMSVPSSAISIVANWPPSATAPSL